MASPDRTLENDPMSDELKQRVPRKNLMALDEIEESQRVSKPYALSLSTSDEVNTRVTDEQDEAMSLPVALSFADHPRPYHTLQAPADTNSELYRALKVIAAAYREAASVSSSGEAAADDLSDMIYIASKTKHAARWRTIAAVHPVSSTWIYEAEEGQSADLHDLWRRCLAEASNSKALVAYREEGEVFKGGWVEIGAALSHGVPVHAVGLDEFTIASFKGITHHRTMKEAVTAALQEPRRIAHPFPSSVQTGVAVERPVVSMPADSGENAWTQINKLFERHGENPPPWRLRDELVTMLVWARYGEALSALSSAPASPDPAVAEMRAATIEECAKRLEETATNLLHRAEQTIAEWTGSDFSDEDNRANRADARSDRLTAEVYGRAAETVRAFRNSSSG